MRTGLTSVLALVLAVALPMSAASESAYLQGLSREVGAAGELIRIAGDAISECNVDLVQCFRAPDPFISRIDNATLGLEVVLANLTSMSVPEEYASSHANLVDGFDSVVQGLRLYTAGLASKDIGSLDQASSLIGNGQEQINSASREILNRSPNQDALILGLSIAIVGALVAICAVGIMVFRQAKRDLGEEKELLATCPVCDEVMDGWSTYNRRQVRGWREEHLKTHRRDHTAAGKD